MQSDCNICAPESLRAIRALNSNGLMMQAKFVSCTNSRYSATMTTSHLCQQKQQPKMQCPVLSSNGSGCQRVGWCFRWWNGRESVKQFDDISCGWWWHCRHEFFEISLRSSMEQLWEVHTVPVFFNSFLAISQFYTLVNCWKQHGGIKASWNWGQLNELLSAVLRTRHDDLVYASLSFLDPQ